MMRVKSQVWLDLSGWTGMVLILLTYSLSTQGSLDPTSGLYLLLNLIGAIGVGSVSLSKRAYQPAVLNLIWAGVAIFGLVKALWH